MAYQSLYRRYRSGRFDELVGQRHVVTALKNAIAEDRVGHAYLFSGPRGTGKTSTARILGKALNCTDLGDDGEPCCACESCLAFEAGTSYDLQELDAASNNGVEAIRDLISKVALGSPGRTKVYILDEVHMLTSGAENALLKTLEEPPDHVVFVLATTEPHKVVPTIRSRTQHFEFELIPSAELDQHVRWVAEDAGLDVDDDMIEYVLRIGGGSARDTLSALDQVVAAGGIPRDVDTIDQVMAGLAAGDPGEVMSAVAQALQSGREPRVIGEALLSRLRDAFLVAMGAPVGHLSDSQTVVARSTADTMGPAAITRALETVGTALIDMRQAPDPRVDLEVALLRLSRPELDTDVAALQARIERLERSGAPAPSTAEAVASPPPVGEGSSPPTPSDPVPPSAPDSSGPAAGARAALAASLGREADVDAAPAQPPASDEATARSSSPTTLGARRATAAADQPDAADPAEDAPPPATPVPPPTDLQPAAQAGTGPTLAQLEAAWDDIKVTLPGRAKSRFSGGRFVSVDGGAVVFGLPNAIHRDRCQECVEDVRSAIEAHTGSSVDLQLVVDGDAPRPPARAVDRDPAPAPAAAGDEEDVIDLDALTDADPDAAGGIDLLTEAFPGAEIIDPEAG